MSSAWSYISPETLLTVPNVHWRICSLRNAMHTSTGAWTMRRASFTTYLGGVYISLIVYNRDSVVPKEHSLLIGCLASKYLDFATFPVSNAGNDPIGVCPHQLTCYLVALGKPIGGNVQWNPAGSPHCFNRFRSSKPGPLSCAGHSTRLDYNYIAWPIDLAIDRCACAHERPPRRNRVSEASSIHHSPLDQLP